MIKTMLKAVGSYLKFEEIQKLSQRHFIPHFEKPWLLAQVGSLWVKILWVTNSMTLVTYISLKQKNTDQPHNDKTSNSSRHFQLTFKTFSRPLFCGSCLQWQNCRLTTCDGECACADRVGASPRFRAWPRISWQQWHQFGLCGSSHQLCLQWPRLSLV